MIRRGASLLVWVGVVGGCGPWQRPGAPPRQPSPSATVPQLFDTRALYRTMGFLVGAPPLSYVASVHFVADATPDSALAVFAMSLPNQALSFRRSGDEFVAEYHVEVAFRLDSATVRQVVRDEVVRVHSFQETLRSDESVIFQQFVAVRPGIVGVRVVVRDRNGPAYSAQERVDTVPQLGGSGGELGSPIAVYHGAGRTRLNVVPDLVVNPRATLPYGADSLRFYVEGYGMGSGMRLAAQVMDPDGVELWHDTVTFAGDSKLATAQIVIPPDELPVGRGELVVGAVGTAARARARLLVSLSDQWAIANFDEMIKLLRYFERHDLVAKLHSASSDQRAAVWREFYRATDPVPITPENEALDLYFQRLGVANQRFQESGGPGWLTDRGEVFITLGEPDEVFEIGNETAVGGMRAIRWDYMNLRLTVYFQETSGFGLYRLTPSSRAEYQRVLAQVRRSQ